MKYLTLKARPSGMTAMLGEVACHVPFYSHHLGWCEKTSSGGVFAYGRGCHDIDPKFSHCILLAEDEVLCLATPKPPKPYTVVFWSGETGDQTTHRIMAVDRDAAHLAAMEAAKHPVDSGYQAVVFGGHIKEAE